MISERNKRIFAAVIRENRTEYQGIADLDNCINRSIEFLFGHDYVDSCIGRLFSGTYLYCYIEPLAYVYCDAELTHRNTGEKIYLYRLD